MQFPQRLARFNRHVTNPVQRLWAGWAPSYGIIEHVGRRWGRVIGAEDFRRIVYDRPGLDLVSAGGSYGARTLCRRNGSLLRALGPSH